MSMIPFEQLPDDARIWIFNTARTMTPQERAASVDALDRFIHDWAAHRKDLAAGYTISHDQFIIVGVDESRLPPSGCSIDALTRFLRELGAHLSLPIIDAPEVCFLQGNDVVCVDRPAFGRLATRGEVNLDTVVFNGMVDRLGALRSGAWSLPARDSWHRHAFDLKEPVGA